MVLFLFAHREAEVAELSAEGEVFAVSVSGKACLLEIEFSLAVDVSLVNVYADYDLEHGLVTDTLLVILHRGDGTDRQHEYPLSLEEQALLLPKMDAYCQEQTGLSLAEYRSQYLAQGQETQGMRTEPTM